MTRAKLRDLAAVTAASFEREFQKLKPILEAESRIQAQISELNAQVAQTALDASQTPGYQIAGADVLWHGWESRTRRDLNTELARVRSRKLAMMEDLRRAFGRKQAVESLQRDQETALRIARARKLMNQ
ncbi:hypothetical protein [Ruegeria arenilitoris]|uniref:hypothetical protein n=1 Tax=Ruegeria arenilitoris TaxID=1173585 RepID=UPI00147CD1ED|nr:hypothetical protein [Ruegeria arenilitoris]